MRRPTRAGRTALPTLAGCRGSSASAPRTATSGGVLVAEVAQLGRLSREPVDDALESDTGLLDERAAAAATAGFDRLALRSSHASASDGGDSRRLRCEGRLGLSLETAAPTMASVSRRSTCSARESGSSGAIAGSSSHRQHPDGHGPMVPGRGSKVSVPEGLDKGRPAGVVLGSTCGRLGPLFSGGQSCSDPLSLPAGRTPVLGGRTRPPSARRHPRRHRRSSGRRDRPAPQRRPRDDRVQVVMVDAPTVDKRNEVVALGLDITEHVTTQGHRGRPLRRDGRRDPAGRRFHLGREGPRPGGAGAQAAQGRRAYAARVAKSPLPSGRTEYRTYAEYLSDMDDLARQVPPAHAALDAGQPHRPRRNDPRPRDLQRRRQRQRRQAGLPAAGRPPRPRMAELRAHDRVRHRPARVVPERRRPIPTHHEELTPGHRSHRQRRRFPGLARGRRRSATSRSSTTR